MVIVFQTKALADTILNEICATPQLEGGVGAVIVWWRPENGENTCQYNQGADGRCAISHPWAEVDCDWLQAYMAEWIADGRVWVGDKLPDDWQYGGEG